MFSFLNGKVVMTGDKYVVVDVNGVGYKVYIPIRILQTISKKDDLVKLYTHAVVNMNDGTFDIYGFTDPADLQVFLMLTSVSGIGPSLANVVISSLDANSIKAAILNDDHEFLSRIPRVGKKTAQRLILELKSKVDLLPGEGDGFKADVDVIDALVSLGYTKNQAQDALNSLPKDSQSSEEKIKAALKLLGSKK